MINPTSTDLPITTSRFKAYNISELPKIILGIQVKNKYDEDRLSIKPEYLPVHIAHFHMSKGFEPVYFYGIEINPKKSVQLFLDDLKDKNFFSRRMNRESTTTEYKELLSKYNLTCDESFGYLADGIFPIDSNKLDHISDTSYRKEIESGFELFVNGNEYPWYINVRNFNIFVICESFGYSIDLELNTLKEKK